MSAEDNPGNSTYQQALKEVLAKHGLDGMAHPAHRPVYVVLGGKPVEDV